MPSKRTAKEEVFVVFGSSTDSGCYSKIISGLEGYKVRNRFAVLSAHKTPKELAKALKKTPAKIFIAGAKMLRKKRRFTTFRVLVRLKQ